MVEERVVNIDKYIPVATLTYVSIPIIISAGPNTMPAPTPLNVAYIPPIIPTKIMTKILEVVASRSP